VRRQAHLPALDGLRGIAILLVVLLHGTEALNRVQPVERSVLAVTNVGYTGVDLFFVLSGFLITGLLLDAKGAPGYFRNFYARRVLRIFPLYYTYLILIFVLLPLLPVTLPATYSELHAHQAWYWTYLSNVFNAANSGWRVDGALTGHFWSLAVEEQFYFIWPAVVLALSPKALRNACLAIIMGAPLLRLGLRLADVTAVAPLVLTVCRVDTLAIGALIALAIRQPSTLPLLRRAALPALGATALVLAGIGAWRGGFGQFEIVNGTIGFSVWAAFYGAGLTTAVLRPVRAAWVASWLSARWLRMFGKYSYAIYVFHRPLCGLAEWGIPTPRMRDAMGSIGAGVAFVCVILLASTVAARASWWLFESRFLKLKDRFQYGNAIASRAAATALVAEPSHGASAQD
jgi:peptidoglycan/LPS O-acetylase OafA/YrhL